MNAAAIGLIGVIVGALLAGTINLVLDRRRRLAEAKAAGRLINVELSIVRQKIASAINAAKSPSAATNGAAPPVPGAAPPPTPASAPRADGPQQPPAGSEQRPPIDSSGWWLGDLPMDAWEKHQSDLAIDIRPQVLEMVARAYALCAVLNDEHAEARKTHAKPQGDLDDRFEAVRLAQERLADEPKIRDRLPRQQLARRSPALAVTLLVLVLAIFALVAPRVDVNSASVTSAVQSGLGRSMLVQCNPGPGDWECTAYPRSWSTSCEAATAAFLGQPRATDYLFAAIDPTPSTCDSTLQPVTFTADVDGGDVVAAVVEQSGHVDEIKKIDATLDRSSAWTRFRRSVFG